MLALQNAAVSDAFIVVFRHRLAALHLFADSDHAALLVEAILCARIQLS